MADTFDYRRFREHLKTEGLRWQRLREQNPIPPAVRAEVLRRASGRCEECGCERPLELHHTTYTRFFGMHGDFGNAGDIFGYETPDDLRALCRECHRGRHVVNGEFYGDPEEAAAERDYLNHMMDKDD
jgi:5-methylcytosine-specific restriction endonuclease McrA